MACDYYDGMLIDGSLSNCWFCFADRIPRGWYAPWRVERAHIVNKPRREDRRAVIGLCSRCHKIQHGERLKAFDYARLDLAGMLWIKRLIDPEFFDLEFLQSCSVRRLPEPVKPAGFCVPVHFRLGVV